MNGSCWGGMGGLYVWKTGPDPGLLLFFPISCSNHFISSTTCHRLVFFFFLLLVCAGIRRRLQKPGLGGIMWSHQCFRSFFVIVLGGSVSFCSCLRLCKPERSDVQDLKYCIFVEYPPPLSLANGLDGDLIVAQSRCLFEGARMKWES